MNEISNRRIVTGVALLALLASERALAAGMAPMNHDAMDHGQMSHGAMQMDHSQMNHAATPPANHAHRCQRSPTPTAAPHSRHCQDIRYTIGQPTGR